MFRQFMQSNQTIQLNLAAEFFYIEECPSEITLRTERGEYRLRKGAQIIDKDMGDRITIENVGAPGNVALVWGFGQYVPPVDGQKVTVQSMPAVNVETLPSVTVETMPAVNVETLPNVNVETLPNVTVKTMPAVDVKTLPSVTVETMPAVDVKTLPSVTVETMPAVDVKTLPSVSIETMPAVELAGGQKVEITTTLSSEFTARAEALPFTLAANPARKKVFIKAPTENVDGVLIGGAFELEQGEWLEMENTAAITFSGVLGDMVQLLEY